MTNYAYYDNGGQLSTTTQVNAAPPPTPGDLVTTTSYSLTAGSGRGVTTTLPDGTHQYQTSNLLGQVTRQWGSQTNPVQFTYDGAGNRATLTTYQAAVTNVETFPSGNGNLTTWTYDPSGVLLSKRDAANQQVTYTYDIAGRVLTREWARGVVTSYGYTADQLTSVESTNDPTYTPAVSMVYDRLGRITHLSNDRSATDYDYDPASLRLIREETTIDPDGAAGPLPSLTRTLDRTRDNLQRPTGFVLGNEHAVGYGYDVSGRLATLSAQGLPNLPGKVHAFEYTHEPGSSLIDKVTGPVHEVDNTYETNRNVLSEKKNIRTVGTPDELSIIGYTVNKIGQREQRNLSGLIRSEFYGGQSEDLYPTGWTYDALGQVTSEDKPATASDRGYTYDQIGNRLTSTTDSVTTTYSSNALNQYSSIENQQSSIINPVHDADGNMTTGLLNGSGNGQFEYDGANQLIRTQATATSDPTRYAYDASGRRIAKVTYPNAGGAATSASVFLYDGWNLIAEYKLNSGAWVLDRTYIWGIDLSGSTQGAGGVGGLLSVTKHEAQSTTHFYPIYDGNGNVEAYIDSNGSPAAIYQYDAFGNVLSGGGKGDALEQANFYHRFSTKYQDAETGLLYYGRRYYHSGLGRWVNRDPIEESGGMNLYEFVKNSAQSYLDVLGRYPVFANPMNASTYSRDGTYYDLNANPLKPRPSAVIDGLHPGLGGLEGEVDQADFFEKHYPDEVEDLKFLQISLINEGVARNCCSRTPPYSIELIPAQMFDDNIISANILIGNMAVTYEFLVVKWEAGAKAGEYNYTWTASMIFIDGLGFDHKPEEKSIGSWVESWFWYYNLGSGGLGLYPDRDLVRARWLIEGGGKCCCKQTP